MPSRLERRADAHDTLRRHFGEERETPHRPARRLRDLGSAHPLFSGTRVVPGAVIEAELEDAATSINRPILQGWTYLLLPFVAACMFAGLVVLGRQAHSEIALGLVLLAGGPVMWLLAVMIGASAERGLVLDRSGVWMRRWTDRWFRRRGGFIGAPDLSHARLTDPWTLEITGPSMRSTINLRWWPPSARADLVDELPLWSVACDWGKHQHHHVRRVRTR